MASLEMVSTEMFECVPNKKEKDLKVLVRDQFDIFRAVDDSGSSEDRKSKVVLECSSRSSVSETEESLQTLSSNSTPLETNSNLFYSPGQPENPSRNEIIIGASSLVQIWEARSQQSSSTQSQSLIDSKTSSGSGVMNLRDIYKRNTETGFAGNANSAVETRNSSRLVSFRVKKVCKTANKTADGNVLQDTMKKSNPRETQDTTNKPKIAKKAVFSEAADNKHGFKKPETESRATEEGEGSKKAMEKAIVKKRVETNKTSLSIREKVNLWDSKDITIRRKNMEDTKNKDKSARRVIDEERAKKEISSIEEGKSMEIEEYRINPQEMTSVISLNQRKEEETESPLSRESGKEEKFSQDDEETLKAEKREESEAFCLILESPIFINGWDGNESEDKEDEDYRGESEYYDWVRDISRPRSYWEDLRKQRELEVIKYSKKDDIQNMIKRRTVSSFLASDLRENIDKILISQADKRLQVEINPQEKDSEEWMVDCSARYQEKLEENETEKIDVETVTVNNGFSQYSTKNAMTTWSLKDHEEAVTSLSISSNRKGHENISSTGTNQTASKRNARTKKLSQILRRFPEQVKSESLSVSVSLERNCSVCFEMSVDSLLYRCGHMSTCLKCGHELQCSKKCPICVAPKASNCRCCDL